MSIKAQAESIVEICRSGALPFAESVDIQGSAMAIINAADEYEAMLRYLEDYIEEEE